MSTEIEHLQQIIESLKQKNLELIKHNQLLQEENSKLTELLEQVDETSATDDDDDDTEELEPVDEEADCEENSKWLPLKGFDDYVIKNYYPYDIKRVSTGHVVKDWPQNTGYVGVHLNNKSFLKHILIARQFIPNDDPKNKRLVDHKNKNRADYHISNLRWVSFNENNQNKTSHLGLDYEFVDEIPGDAIKVDSYGKYKFEDYFFINNTFYFHTGVEYRVLRINIRKDDGSKFVNAMSTNGKRIRIYYSKFKRLYNLE